jgi:hypothetical protein
MRYGNQADGNLIVDANMDGVTASGGTRLPLVGPGKTAAVTADTLTGDGIVAWPVNGLIGLRLNPDTDQAETFEIVANTADVLVVQTPNENGRAFAAVAGVNAVYGGEWTFDNVFFRRGGHLECGDRLVVTETMAIEEYGLLTHPETTTVYAPRLDLEVDNLVIASDSRIDVTGRGYLGGDRAGLGSTGYTVGFTPGAQHGNGGSYGGLGGHYSGSGGNVPNPVYGSVTDPVDLGSGGGAWGGHGGDGGGRIFILATDITVDGVIRANGGLSGGTASGEGSGGTVNIETVSLGGTGMVTADGGTTNGSNHTGGGGGRIAIRYQDLTLPQAGIRALGGDGQYGDGEDGSVYLNQ